MIVRSNSFKLENIKPETEYKFDINLNIMTSPPIEMMLNMRITAATKACTGRNSYILD